MSKKEIKRRLVLSNVMKKAWSIYRSNKENITFSYCLKTAWSIVNGIIYSSYSKVRGVTFENRQILIKRLLKYNPKCISLSLQPEPTNLFDSEAIKIIASVKGKGSATIGYVSKELNSMFNRKMEEGKNIILELENITGTIDSILGINYSYLII